MKLGFSSLGCPDWDLETIIAQAAAMGYQGIELRGLQGEMHLPGCAALAQNPDGVKTRLREANVQLVCLGTGNCFHHADARRVADEKAAVREFIELAGHLEVPYVRVFGDEVPRGDSKPAVMLRIVEALKDLAPVAAANRTTILLENHGDFCGSRDLWFMIDAVGHPAVQGCWNPCHARAYGEKSGLAIPRLGRKIEMVHLVDGKFTAHQALDHYAIPGEGDLGLEHFLDLLRGIAFQGYLMFEWPKLWLPGLADPERAFPAAKTNIERVLNKLNEQKELSAYKGDKNVPRFAAATSRF